jgi:hypothetical protein
MTGAWQVYGKEIDKLFLSQMPVIPDHPPPKRTTHPRKKDRPSRIKTQTNPEAHANEVTPKTEAGGASSLA